MDRTKVQVLEAVYWSSFKVVQDNEHRSLRLERERADP